MIRETKRKEKDQSLESEKPEKSEKSEENERKLWRPHNPFILP